MIYWQSFKNRDIKHGQRVRVYRNLRRSLGSGGPVYSVADATTMKVLGHTECCILNWATFEVRETGRKRVLETGHKNIHAYITGYWDDEFSHRDLQLMEGYGREVIYDPYLHRSFLDEVERYRVDSADVVVLRESGVYYTYSSEARIAILQGGWRDVELPNPAPIQHG